MAYFLKIMSVIVAVLAVIVLVLSVLFFLVLEINSNFFPPEVVEIIYKIEITKEVPGLFTQENVGTYLEVLTGIVALLFPVSLSIISDSKGKYFDNKEVTEYVFSKIEYKGLYAILTLLILMTGLSFINELPSWVLVIMLFTMILSLIFLFLFFRKLEKVIGDLPQLVRESEKGKIDNLLGNG